VGASGGTGRTYRKFLTLAEIGSIAGDLKAAGDDSTVSPEDARVLVNCYLTWRERVKRLLTIVGQLAKCRVCGEGVYWCRMQGPNGTLNPIGLDGVSHFVNCPSAKPDGDLVPDDHQPARDYKMEAAGGD
jgi:hypothetical protein